jgi:ABC-type transport system substrate-binding protein
MPYPNPADLEAIRKDPNVQVLEQPGLNVGYLAYNVTKKPFDDVRVRKAVNMAINKKAIIDAVYLTAGVAAKNPIPPTQWSYNDAIKDDPYDTAAAKKLLADAGYPNGFEVTFDCGDNAPAPDICQAIPPMLAQIGIKVRPNIMPGSNFFPKLQKFDTSMYLLSWGTPTFDALYTLLGLLHSHATDNSGNGDSNYGRYSNPKVDKLIQQIKTEFDMKKRDAYIREVLLIARDDLPVLPLHQPIAPWAMRKGVTAQFAPNNVPYFYRFSAN